MRRIDGRRFTLTGHPEHDQDAADHREFAVIEVEWIIVNNVPLSGHEANYPHSLYQAVKQAEADDTDKLFAVSHADGSTGFYRVAIEAQRTSVPYHSPSNTKARSETRIGHRCRSEGAQAYTDDLNRIKVLFIWDRHNQGDERASCWVRVAQSDTGDGYGGVHMPRARNC